MRVCSIPGCPEIHNGASSRCEKHTREAKQAHWDKTRAYSSRGHRTFRDAVLRREPICVLCQLRQATVADHHPRSRKELESLLLNPNDPAYGRGLCVPCHNASTARLQPGGWNAR